MNWLLLGVIFVLLIVFFKSKEVKHKAASIVVIMLVLFFALSFSQVVSRPGVNFSTVDGFLSAGGLYLSWLKNVFSNLGQITGNAVRLDWSANLTNFTK